jgi:gluconolactonase
MRIPIALALLSAGVLPLCAGVVDRSSPLEKIPGEFGLADGPAWSGGLLYVPDVKGKKLFSYNPRSKKFAVVLDDGGRISASFYNHDRLYVSDNGNAQISYLEGKQLVRIAGQDPNAKPPARPNDLVVDNRGGIYYTLTGQAQVIYISPEGEQSVAVEGITTANGIILSPDGSTLYVAAYKPKEIWAYDVKGPGKTAKGRKFATMDDGEALGADGMCIDRAGNVYCAGAMDIWIWSPSGKLIDKINCPERPINCAFGDSDLRSLYITGFGGLYRQRMNAYGVSPTPSAAKPTSPSAGRPSTELPEAVTAHLDVVYAQDGDRKLLTDIFVPAGKGPHPAIVVVHGGGWLNGDKTKFRALAQQLAARGYVTSAIQYRLGYEAKFPKGAQDCFASVRFLRDHASKYSVDPNRIGVVGGSAGGHLAGLMATAWNEPKLKGAFDHSSQSARVSAVIVMAGPMAMVSGSVAENSRKPGKKGSNSNVWLDGTVDEAPELYRLADAFEQISADDAPILFMVGEHDNPARNEESRNKLKSVGVWSGLKVYPDGKHGCWNQLPWFNDMVADMDQFFGERLR